MIIKRPTLNRYPHMVQEYFVQRMRSFTAERDAKIAALSTRNDAEDYVHSVKKAVAASFSPFPVRTPLNPVITGRLTCQGYSIDKILFESRPGFIVTANLYIPQDLSKPAPAVLGLCGHDPDSKAYVPYQTFCIQLAKKGFITLIFDPISQGERRQFYPEDGLDKPLWLCDEHNMMGKQATLTGDFFGTMRAWDGIRALDYLAGRPEVDKTRIGVTGNSGGGTLSAYLSGLDSRFTMAAPSCFITTYLANLENELPTDAEQVPPGIIKSGLDMVDLLIAAAPRPTILLTQKHDFFDQRGSRKAYADIRKIYRLLGAEKSLAYFMGPREHGYSAENREAMYGFFMKHARVHGSSSESKIILEKPEALWATPEGSTYKYGSKRIFEFTGKAARDLSGKRINLTIPELRQTVQHTLGISKRPEKFHFRVLRPLSDNCFQFSIETEKGIQALLTYTGSAIPPFSPLCVKSIVLYVPHVSAFDELPSDALRKIAGKQILCAVDPRNTGESMADTCGDGNFFAPYGSDYMYAAYSEMFGESLLGKKVWDVLCVMDFLLDNGVKKITLAGSGLGSIIAAFAGFLHPVKPEVIIWNYLKDYHGLTQVPVFDWPFSCMLRGVLKKFDLPDIYRGLGGKLKKSRAWNESMR